jgi:hypothetical protein
MNIDGTDLIVATMYYKDHVFGNEKVRVFVDWGESLIDGYVMYGSPFQLQSENWTGLGTSPDSTILFKMERIDTSFPTEGQPAVDLPVGMLHFKPGINV